MKKLWILMLIVALMVPMSAQAASCSQASKPQVTTSPAVSGTNMSAMASQVLAETNKDRAKAGLPALVMDAELTAAACVRAKEIVSKFSHTRPNGSGALTVSGKAKAENIAKGQQSAAKVMAAWMSSAGHKRNILRKSSTRIGICAYRVNGIMYWVQLFN